jgi:hypothetical protein
MHEPSPEVREQRLSNAGRKKSEGAREWKQAESTLHGCFWKVKCFVFSEIRMVKIGSKGGQPARRPPCAGGEMPRPLQRGPREKSGVKPPNSKLLIRRRRGFGRIDFDAAFEMGTVLNADARGGNVAGDGAVFLDVNAAAGMHIADDLAVSDDVAGMDF